MLADDNNANMQTASIEVCAVLVFDIISAYNKIVRQITVCLVESSNNTEKMARTKIMFVFRFDGTVN